MRYQDLVTVDGEGEWLVLYADKYSLRVRSGRITKVVDKERCERIEYC